MNKIINVAVIFIEVSVVALLFILETMSGQKAGVNHHVLARKIQWNEKYFTPENIKILTFGLIAIILFAIFIQIVSGKKKQIVKQGKILWTHNVAAILAVSIAVLSLKNRFFMSLNTSGYITFASIAIFIFEIFLIIYLVVIENKYK
ncbi:hypothetical protein [Proteocatella sphenisci]|uniref:hypothetical protein n=1 Tax=Proteocatella sphenisci TaxID=181070 RepID=UPI00048DA8A9|nr:hypothetical protein [Proteocatella sphenisci]